MLLNNTPLYVGTSGYNHEDWKGNFAPENIHNYDLLTYYAEKGLNFLELAFTFYRLPEADKIKHILMRTGTKVKFSVRLPKTLIRNPDNEADYKELMKGLKPMLDEDLLACVYADYHQSFSVSKKNQEMIKLLKDRFEVPFFAELTNRTWYKGRIFEYFKEHNIGLTIIDMPEISGFAPYYPICTNNNIYCKYYGRSKAWFTQESKVLDYDYSEDQIRKFLSEMNDKSVTASSIFAVFANVADGFAPKNALQMLNMANHFTH